MRTDPYVTMWALTAVAVVVAIATAAMIGYVIYYYVFRRLFAPTRRSPARVLRKRQRESRLSGEGILTTLWRLLGSLEWWAPDDRDDATTGGCDYSITFATAEGQLEFDVSEDLYTRVHEGDEGLLVYRGTLLRHFIPQSVPRQS